MPPLSFVQIFSLCSDDDRVRNEDDRPLSALGGVRCVLFFVRFRSERFLSDSPTDRNEFVFVVRRRAWRTGKRHLDNKGMTTRISDFLFRMMGASSNRRSRASAAGEEAHGSLIALRVSKVGLPTVALC